MCPIHRGIGDVCCVHCPAVEYSVVFTIWSALGPHRMAIECMCSGVYSSCD